MLWLVHFLFRSVNSYWLLYHFVTRQCQQGLSSFGLFSLLVFSMSHSRWCPVKLRASFKVEIDRCNSEGVVDGNHFNMRMGEFQQQSTKPSSSPAWSWCSTWFTCKNKQLASSIETIFNKWFQEKPPGTGSDRIWCVKYLHYLLCVFSYLCMTKL